MKLTQIVESLDRKYLVETIKNNTFYWVSNKQIDGKPKPGPEGIHINQSISGINSVKQNRTTDAYLYIIKLSDNLSLYKTDKDPGRWDAMNLAALLLEDKAFISKLTEQEIEKLEQCSSIPSGKSKYSDLWVIEDIMNKYGYNAIAYVNNYEQALKPSIMLFNNRLIKSCKYKGKL